MTFEYNWNGTWTKISSDCTQQGWNVTKASVTPAGDIPAAGGTYTVTLTGWGGYKIRAISGSTELVVKNDYKEVPNYSASIVIPANTGTAARNVTFQYSQSNVWKDIETRTQGGNQLKGVWGTHDDCVQRCSRMGGLMPRESLRNASWDGWYKTWTWTSEQYDNKKFWQYDPSNDNSNPYETTDRALCRCFGE